LPASLTIAATLPRISLAYVARSACVTLPACVAQLVGVASVLARARISTPPLNPGPPAPPA
jgi:hypothetical protein